MPRRFTGLWRQPDFLKLWAGQTVSLFGSQITPIALPLLAALTLGATPAEMAFLRTAQYVPALLIGLFAGVWIDRLRRRPVLIGADLGSAAVLLALPLAIAFGLLRMELLYTVAFLLGVLSVFFGVAYAAFLPTVVGRESLVEGNSKLAASSAVARIAGPGLAGVLVQTLTAPVAIAIDGLSFLVAALALGRIRALEPSPTRVERRNVWREIAEGLRMLGRDPYLRAFTASSATLDIFWNALFAVYFLYVTRTLALPPGAIGLIFGLGSAGALLGSLLAGWIARHAGIGTAIIGAQIVVGLGSLLIGLSVWLPASALLLLVAAELVQSCASTIYGINRGSLTQAITPDRLLGRVSGSGRFVGLGVAALGTALGGMLGERIGVPATIVVGSCGGVLAFLWLLFSPVRTLRGIPSSEDRPSVA